MKTPKEYAVELVREYRLYSGRIYAQRCATLAVNEVLYVLEQIDSNHPAIDEMYQRYKLVKDEIQKL